MIPPAQLGWMAGVVDLKGRIIRKNNKSRATPQLVLMVESKEHPIISELGRMTGTSPETSRPAGIKKDWDRRGCTEHCPDSHVHVPGWSYPDVGRWTITGVAMGVVVWNLSPLLHNKKRGLVEAMLEAFNNATFGRGSGATFEAINRLQVLGWELPSEVYEKMVKAGMYAAKSEVLG